MHALRKLSFRFIISLSPVAVFSHCSVRIIRSNTKIRLLRARMAQRSWHHRSSYWRVGPVDHAFPRDGFLLKHQRLSHDRDSPQPHHDRHGLQRMSSGGIRPRGTERVVSRRNESAHNERPHRSQRCRPMQQAESNGRPRLPLDDRDMHIPRRSAGCRESESAQAAKQRNHRQIHVTAELSESTDDLNNPLHAEPISGH